MSGLIHYFMLAVLFCSRSSVLAQLDSVQNEILKRLENLQAEVHRQRESESKVHNLESKVRSLQSDVQTLESKVLTLETKVETLESEVQYSRRENEVLQDELSSLNAMQPPNLNKDNVNTKAKRLIGSDIIPQLVPSATAFHAVITSNFDKNIGTHHVFIYDHVVCNLGGAYNNVSGMFTAPRSRIYAFLWNIVAEGVSSNYGEIETELLVNSQPKGWVDADTEVASDDDQSTGFVIVQLNQGDLVYVRSSTNISVQGVFQRYRHGGWTFSGWQIA